MKKTKRLYEMSKKERIKQSDEHAVREAERQRLEQIRKKKTKKTEVCQICGLPRDLCVCEQFTVSTNLRINKDREQQT